MKRETSGASETLLVHFGTDMSACRQSSVGAG